MFDTKIAKNTIASLVLKLTTIACGFVLPRLVIGQYGSEINGMVNSITNFLGLISFLELGVGAVVQSSLYKPLVERDNYKISCILLSAQTFFNKIGLILCIYTVILMLVYPLICIATYSYIFTSLLIIAISISLFGQYFFGIVNTLLLTADQRGYIYYNIQTITLILNTLVCCLMISLEMSIHAVKFVASLIFIIRPIYLAYYVHKNYNLSRNIDCKLEPLKQKWNGIAQHIASVVLDSSGTIILTIFGSLSLVSVFSVYNIIVQGVKSLVLSLLPGIQPLIGKLLAQRALDRLYATYSWTEWGIHTLTTLFFGITSVLMIPFIKVYTSGINDSNYILPLFGILITYSNACYCYRLPYNIMILAGGHYKETQVNYVIATIINLFISILSVYFFGIIGVTFGMFFAMIFQILWMAHYDSKHFIHWPMKNVYKQILVNILTLILIYLLTYIFELNKISYIEWFVLSVKVSLFSCLISFLVNFLFYRNKIIKLAFMITKKI